MDKKLTPAQLAKKKRDDAILRLYETMRPRFPLAVDLYRALGKKVGCSQNTVIAVLQRNGII